MKVTRDEMARIREEQVEDASEKAYTDLFGPGGSRYDDPWFPATQEDPSEYELRARAAGEETR